MTFVIDIDDTLLLYDNDYTGLTRYKSAKPNIKEIKLVNEKYKKGNKIIIHTGRNWDKYDFTKKQLKEFKIKYHELIMGKPQGIYIDKDSYKSIEEYND